MDRITHQVRLANWTKIIEQCNNRPAGTTAKQWLSDNGISDKSYYYWLRKLRQEAYANAEKEFPAVTPSQEQQPAVTFAEIPLPNQQNSMTFTTDLCCCINVWKSRADSAGPEISWK